MRAKARPSFALNEYASICFSFQIDFNLLLPMDHVGV